MTTSTAASSSGDPINIANEKDDYSKEKGDASKELLKESCTKKNNVNIPEIEESLIEALLRRDPEVEGISAGEYLYLENEMEREAKLRFPGKFDTCTYELGKE